MNLKDNIEYSKFISALFEGQLEIAVIVSKGKHYFVFDDKENFVIDIKPFYDSYLEKGIIDKKNYLYALNKFRGGATSLSNENLDKYFLSLSANNIKTLDWMKCFFQYDVSLKEFSELYIYIENYLMCGVGEIDNKKWYLLENRLPKFYINLDRKLFFHTDWQRDFEKQLPENWIGKASSQFWSLIPDRYQYWIINEMNFWKLYG